ncbi:hypothetical protein [Actinokineospora fastidiosa]|uniref:Uncharacterized protein n=1 Tax=Actinokineospora fastidiosa TaxID=1816 RepID=A0A918GCU2_9PSEU|nr:hypothetical protein [Actinokineospora fastidiosa]GGS28730.1 hypothetical protein GCM10010171_22320 [Actinokineospora fastidiosa]
MLPRYRITAAMAPALFVTGIGLVEVVRQRDWDLVTILAAVLVAQIAALAAGWGGRQPASLRADLAVWLHDHAASTGEPAGRIVDRAVADHRAAMEAAPSTAGKS